MKAKLEFDLPEENEEFKLATKAIDYYCALDDIRQYIRQLYKYDDVGEVSIDELHDKFWEILNDRGIDL